MTARNGSAEWHGSAESGSGTLAEPSSALADREDPDLGVDRGVRFKRSRMRRRTEKRLVDRMIGAYIDWWEACRLVQDAYRSWASATGPRARVAFWRYTAALDVEESAAEVYAGLVRRVGHLAASNDDLSGPLAA